jgi:hypothetical protein
MTSAVASATARRKRDPGGWSTVEPHPTVPEWQGIRHEDQRVDERAKCELDLPPPNETRYDDDW